METNLMTKEEFAKISVSAGHIAGCCATGIQQYHEANSENIYPYTNTKGTLFYKSGGSYSERHLYVAKSPEQYALLKSDTRFDEKAPNLFMFIPSRASAGKRATHYSELGLSVLKKNEWLVYNHPTQIELSKKLFDLVGIKYEIIESNVWSGLTNTFFAEQRNTALYKKDKYFFNTPSVLFKVDHIPFASNYNNYFDSYNLRYILEKKDSLKWLKYNRVLVEVSK